MRKVSKFEKNASSVRNKLLKLLTEKEYPFLKILSPSRMIRVPWKVSARGWNIARKFVRTFSRGDATTGVRCKKTDKETHCRLNAAGTHLAWIDLERH